MRPCFHCGQARRCGGTAQSVRGAQVGCSQALTRAPTSAAGAASAPCVHYLEDRWCPLIFIVSGHGGMSRRPGLLLLRSCSALLPPTGQLLSSLPASWASSSGVRAAVQQRMYGESRVVRWFGLAAAGLALSTVPVLCSDDSGTSTSDSDASGDDSGTSEASGDDSGPDKYELAYNRNIEQNRKRRAQQRGGEDPMPASARRKTNEDQYAAETSGDAVVAACKFKCNCGQAFCVEPDVNLVEACRRHKFDQERGLWLARLLRGAAVRGADGELRVDKKTARISLGRNNQFACWRRFKSLFGIKDRMATELLRYAQAPTAAASLWNSTLLHRPPPGMKPKQEVAQEWIRAWAKSVGCFMPNATNSIHVDAQRLKTIWLLYNHETHEWARMDYKYFCKAYNIEKDKSPVIRQRKKKDVSSPCKDCVTLDERLALALESKDKAAIEVVKAAQDRHYAKVREERDFQWGIARESRDNPPPHLSLVWDMMDQSKLHVPNWKGPLKLRMQKKQRCVMRLMGCTDHGSGKWFAFAAPPWVPKGGNLTCTTLYLTLRELKRRHGSLPRHMKVRTSALRRRS